MISKTDKGKYFKLWERKAHSLSLNSKSLWCKYLYFFKFNFLSLKTKKASTLSGKGLFLIKFSFFPKISLAHLSTRKVSLTFKSLSKILYK